MSGFVYILASHIKIYRIYLNDLVAKLNQNKLQKIENRSKIGKTERGRETLPAAHLGHLPVAGPAPPAGPAHLLPFVFFLPSHRSSSVASADAASATSCLPACLRYSLETPRGPLDPLSLSRISPSVPIPLSVFSLACRSRRASLTRQHAAARARRQRGSGGHLVPCVPPLGS